MTRVATANPLAAWPFLSTGDRCCPTVAVIWRALAGLMVRVHPEELYPQVRHHVKIHRSRSGPRLLHRIAEEPLQSYRAGTSDLPPEVDILGHRHLAVAELVGDLTGGITGLIHDGGHGLAEVV